MKTIVTYNADRYCPYPGEYKPPFFNWNEITEELHKPHEGNQKPPVNISEGTGHYKVELIAPGHSKEDFIVDINNNNLSIVVVKPNLLKGQNNYRLHEFNFECFSYELKLPGNIDADFVCAEYKAGILSVFFSKADKPTTNKLHNIIVY